MTDVHWVGASVTGRVHARSANSNQDRWRGWSGRAGSVVVLSDGMGSRTHGARSAEAACDAVVATISEASAQGLAVQALPAAIEREWARQLDGVPRSAVGATCLFSWAPHDGPVVAGQIGDGIVLWRADGGVRRLVPAKTSWLNETSSLGGGEWHIAEVWESRRPILLASDGVADDIDPGAEEELWELTTGLVSDEGPTRATERLRRELEGWPSPSSKDDRTLVLHLP